MWEEGNFGFRGMEVWLCEQILGQVASAGGETPVELAGVHCIYLRGGVITFTENGGGRRGCTCTCTCTV